MTTGRSRDRKPALQNIPIRHSETREIVEALLMPPPEPLTIDYTALELRVLAQLQDDKAPHQGRKV